MVKYFVQRAQIAGDQITLFRIDEDSVIIVIADITDEYCLLANGQESALEGGYLLDNQT